MMDFVSPCLVFRATARRLRTPEDAAGRNPYDHAKFDFARSAWIAALTHHSHPAARLA